MLNSFWSNIVERIARHLQQCAADPAHSIVLLPFAQLLPVARKQWALIFPNSILPRFETSTSWAQRLRPFTPGATDLAFDAATDLLTAQALLQQAGLSTQAQWLAPRVREAALQLAPIAAAYPPQQRSSWAAEIQTKFLTIEPASLQYEQAIAAVALTWVAYASYATDILFEQIHTMPPEALIVLQGLQQDPLATRLQILVSSQKPDTTCLLELFDRGLRISEKVATLPAAQLHYTQHFEDMAQRTAACVQQAVERGQGLVALVDLDRALTRRIRALLEGQGLALRDETGWRLSTTHAASQLMALLRACSPQASSDAVLAWLKLAQTANSSLTTPQTGTGFVPIQAIDVDAIEAHLRSHMLSEWPTAAYWKAWQHVAAPFALHAEQWRQKLLHSRTLSQWLDDTRTVLQTTGQWQWLQTDLAGQTLIQMLHWNTEAVWSELQTNWPQKNFIHWVTQTLESGHFMPSYPLREQVVIVPLAQLLARPFAAVVVPGCDDQRLPAAPELAGLWTTAQRTLLGLPSRAQVQQSQRDAWQHLLCYQSLDLLLSHHENNAPVLPSPLLLEWQLATDQRQRSITAAADPRIWHNVPSHTSTMPRPQGKKLPVLRISASSYDALRICPYRFFALHQLHLREIPELTADIDKRDFGTWLHRVLYLFHQEVANQNQALTQLPYAALIQRMDSAAEQARIEQHLDVTAFLPYELAWPTLRDGYLRWLIEAHADINTIYIQGESQQQRTLADAVGPEHADILPPHSVQLVGTIDRIDRYESSGRLLLIDYKTEDPKFTSQRINEPSEDTQLLFYAALLSPEPVNAAYLNIGERGKTSLYLHEEAAAQSRYLLHGMAQDLRAIANGAPLPALGQGSRCDYCAARGLCRRDFWEEFA